MFDDTSGPAWMNGVVRVVMNREEQYSVWPVDRALPAGWTDVGIQGSKSECLAHIEKVWTDMRPLSLRQSMDRRPLA
jgi:MbtH protein